MDHEKNEAPTATSLSMCQPIDRLTDENKPFISPLHLRRSKEGDTVGLSLLHHGFTLPNSLKICGLGYSILTQRSRVRFSLEVEIFSNVNEVTLDVAFHYIIYS